MSLLYTRRRAERMFLYSPLSSRVRFYTSYLFICSMSEWCFSCAFFFHRWRVRLAHGYCCLPRKVRCTMDPFEIPRYKRCKLEFKSIFVTLKVQRVENSKTQLGLFSKVFFLDRVKKNKECVIQFYARSATRLALEARASTLNDFRSWASRASAAKQVKKKK